MLDRSQVYEPNGALIRDKKNKWNTHNNWKNEGVQATAPSPSSSCHL